MRLIAAALSLIATQSLAQEIEVTPLQPLDLDAVIADVLEEAGRAEVPTRSIDAVVLRAVDKLNGTVEDLSFSAGIALGFGSLSLTMTECRYPEDNPSGEAFAFLDIYDNNEPAFSGWMIASSPALNALDHPRYDVWVLRCKTSDAEGG